VSYNQCGCNHWTTPKCPANKCPWQGLRPVDRALKLRGQYGVALDLLTECVYPMKVCAAVVENEVDDDGLERLIEQVREFVAHARGLKKGDTPSTEGEQG